VPAPGRYDFTHHELTGQILRACFEVYGELGTGFLESVYEAAVCAVLSRSGLIVQQQVSLPVWFRGEQIARFRADVVVEGVVVLEFKAARSIDPVHEAQLLNYLKASRIGIGLLFNFGPRPRFRRMVFTPPGIVQTPFDALLQSAEACHA
jgi:GxxExxY protein